MYSSDLGWVSIENCYKYSADDAFIAARLQQIKADPSTPLISRWTFKTQNTTNLSYLGHVVLRVASCAALIIPAFWVTTYSGKRLMDYLFDWGNYLYYAKYKGEEKFYQDAKRLTQIYLTLVVANERIMAVEMNKQDMQPIQEYTIGARLLLKAQKKTLQSLSEEDLTTLNKVINQFPIGQRTDPSLQKKILLETLKRGTSPITLNDNLEFVGEQCNAFISTKRKVDLCGAKFKHVSEEAVKALNQLNEESSIKATIEPFVPLTF